MATDAIAPGRWHKLATFLQEAYHEVRYKTTWPDWPQVRQASIAIVIFVLIIGIVITLLDLVLSGILVNLIPALLR